MVEGRVGGCLFFFIIFLTLMPTDIDIKVCLYCFKILSEPLKNSLEDGQEQINRRDQTIV